LHNPVLELHSRIQVMQAMLVSMSSSVSSAKLALEIAVEVEEKGNKRDKMVVFTDLKNVT
jgi:hypothetical protein